jgi:mono/diheme cytochrome c family protein
MKSSLPFFALAVLLLGPATAKADQAELIARGEYLATVMDCAGCHMPRGSDGVPIFEAGLSGGNVGFEIPGIGVVWPPNLTPSKTGLGSWTDDQIATAITGGLTPDGRSLAPAMPWPAYSALNEYDRTALVAYLRSMPAVDTKRLDPITESSTATAPYYRVMLPNK